MSEATGPCTRTCPEDRMGEKECLVAGYGIHACVGETQKPGVSLVGLGRYTCHDF